MDYFAHFIGQPPIPDREINDLQSYYSEQFSVNKERCFKGFNDDVSEIEAGSEQINEDSINQIKREHKLLSGRRQTEHRFSPYNDDSKQQSVQECQTYNQHPIRVQCRKKVNNNSKVSLQSKLEPYGQFPSQLTNIHRQYTTGNRKLPSRLGHLILNKQNYKKILTELTQLKQFKQETKQIIQEQWKEYLKLVETNKISIEIQVRNKMFIALAAKQKQILISLRNAKTNQQIEQNHLLQARLKQSQDKAKNIKQQLQQLMSQNQVLQQKVFDLEQKTVGINLQVQEKFAKKRKQLQIRIYEEVMKNRPTQNSVSNGMTSNLTFSQSQNVNKNNNQIVQSLISQNQSLEAKCKSYQAILLQTDHYCKLKQELDFRQQGIRQKQKQIQTHRQQVSESLNKNNQRQLDFQYAQQGLNKKLISLKEGHKNKQDQLNAWQQSLTAKAEIMNQRERRQSQKYSWAGFGSSNIKGENLTLEKLAQKKKFSNLKQFNYYPQQQLSQKLQRLDLQKAQSPLLPNTQIDTFRNFETQKKSQPNSQGIMDQGINSLTSVYDPRKHKEYEQYDMNDKYKFRLNNLGKYPQRQRQNQTKRLSSYKNYNAQPVNYISRTVDQVSTSKNKKTSPQFYKPQIKVAFKYEPRYVSKPLSTPLNHPNGLIDVRNNERSSNQYLNIGSQNTRGRQHAPYGRSINQIQPREIRGLYMGDRQSVSKSSKDNSRNYGSNNGRTSYQGYDVSRDKQKLQITGNLSSLGNKLQMLKSELKTQIDSIL